MALDQKISAMPAATTPLTGAELLALALAGVSNKHITFDQLCVEILQRGLAAASPKLALKTGAFNFSISADANGYWSLTDGHGTLRLDSDGALVYNDGVEDRISLFPSGGDTVLSNSLAGLILTFQNGVVMDIANGNFNMNISADLTINGQTGFTGTVVTSGGTKNVLKGIIIN